jgi:hypothetical protein
VSVLARSIGLVPNTAMQLATPASAQGWEGEEGGGEEGEDKPCGDAAMGGGGTPGRGFGRGGWAADAGEG